MTLVSLLLALVLEQFKPFKAAAYLYPPLERLGRFFEERFNDGQAKHGVIAWCLMVLPPTVATAVAYFLIYTLHPLLALLFNVVVLYCTMGFRHSSHFFTRIHGIATGFGAAFGHNSLHVGQQNVSRQSGLARPRDTGHCNQTLQGNVRVHRLQVVQACTDNA